MLANRQEVMDDKPFWSVSRTLFGPAHGRRPPPPPPPTRKRSRGPRPVPRPTPQVCAVPPPLQMAREEALRRGGAPVQQKPPAAVAPGAPSAVWRQAVGQARAGLYYAAARTFADALPPAEEDGGDLATGRRWAFFYAALAPGAPQRVGEAEFREAFDAQERLASGADAAGRAGAAPRGWLQYRTPAGVPYYFSLETRATQWDRPHPPALAAASPRSVATVQSPAQRPGAAGASPHASPTASAASPSLKRKKPWPAPFAVWYVRYAPEGPGAGSGTGTAAQPYGHIGTALTRAEEGAEIVLLPGTYPPMALVEPPARLTIRAAVPDSVDIVATAPGQTLLFVAGARELTLEVCVRVCYAPPPPLKWAALPSSRPPPPPPASWSLPIGRAGGGVRHVSRAPAACPVVGRAAVVRRSSQTCSPFSWGLLGRGMGARDGGGRPHRQ